MKNEKELKKPRQHYQLKTTNREKNYSSSVNVQAFWSKHKFIEEMISAPADDMKYRMLHQKLNAKQIFSVTSNESGGTHFVKRLKTQEFTLLRPQLRWVLTWHTDFGAHGKLFDSYDEAAEDYNQRYNGPFAARLFDSNGNTLKIYSWHSEWLQSRLIACANTKLSLDDDHTLIHFLNDSPKQPNMVVNCAFIKWSGNNYRDFREAVKFLPGNGLICQQWDVATHSTVYNKWIDFDQYTAVRDFASKYSNIQQSLDPSYILPERKGKLGNHNKDEIDSNQNESEDKIDAERNKKCEV